MRLIVGNRPYGVRWALNSNDMANWHTCECVGQSLLHQRGATATATESTYGRLKGRKVQRIPNSNDYLGDG